MRFAILKRSVLVETGLPPERLEIELTESTIFADRERALHSLRQIKGLGVSVALDDFGTGYSSPDTLRAFPFDKIKLDRSFMSESTPQIRAIIRAVLAIGKVTCSADRALCRKSLIPAKSRFQARGHLTKSPPFRPDSRDKQQGNPSRSAPLTSHAVKTALERGNDRQLMVCGVLGRICEDMGTRR